MKQATYVALCKHLEIPGGVTAVSIPALSFLLSCFAITVLMTKVCVSVDLLLITPAVVTLERNHEHLTF